jgi:hypothetical protein
MQLFEPLQTTKPGDGVGPQADEEQWGTGLLSWSPPLALHP